MPDKEPLPPELAPFLTSVFSEDNIKGLLQAYPQEAFDILRRQSDRKIAQEKAVENRRQRAATEAVITKRLGLLLIFSTLVVVLLYAGLTKDTELPEKIIDIFVGAIAGLVAGSTIKKRED